MRSFTQMHNDHLDPDRHNSQDYDDSVCYYCGTELPRKFDDESWPDYGLCDAACGALLNLRVARRNVEHEEVYRLNGKAVCPTTWDELERAIRELAKAASCVIAK